MQERLDIDVQNVVGHHEAEHHEQHRADTGFHEDASQGLALWVILSREVRHGGQYPGDEEHGQPAHQAEGTLPTDGPTQQCAQWHAQYQCKGCAGPEIAIARPLKRAGDMRTA